MDAKKYSTTHAVGKNNFFIGMACAFNLFGNFFPYPIDNPNQTDIEAIANDWGMVGQDLREVLQNGAQTRSK